MKALPLLVLAFTLTFIGSSFLTPFDGFDQGQLPIPQEDPPVQPAGWAFSIWIVIYAGLLASAAYGLGRRADDAEWDRARWPLLASLILGTPWLAVATRSAVWATILIALMAATAIWAMLASPARDRWWLRAPVGLYAGWLTAATAVALGSTMAGYGILMGPLGWAFLCVALALVAAVAVLVRRPEAAYAVAVAWALFGIAVKNGATYPGLTLLAVAGILSVASVAWARRARA